MIVSSYGIGILQLVNVKYVHSYTSYVAKQVK